ncbi:MAG TPA: hypothetical protein VHA35_24520 [Dongiaceae bacterium]|jgi:hypothetical protein|nr:hypothetical protein [Dongiaceae bacterium]
MVRFTFARASLMGFAAAGLIAVASAGPACAQTRSYPDGTDCAAMQGGAEPLECLQQLGRRQHGSSLFSPDFSIRVAPPDQRGIGLDDGGGGGTQTPVVPNNGARAPLGADDGTIIGTLHW